MNLKLILEQICQPLIDWNKEKCSRNSQTKSDQLAPNKYAEEILAEQTSLGLISFAEVLGRIACNQVYFTP